jgi:hypothetical protein
MRCAKIEWVVEWGISVDQNFLKAHAERCRLIAEHADEFCSKSSLTQSSVLGDGESRIKSRAPRDEPRRFSNTFTFSGVPLLGIAAQPEPRCDQFHLS